MHVRTASAIGAAIRSRRRELKLDQEHLARKIGATRQWLIAIEKGKDTAEIGMVLRALSALGLDLDVQPTNTRTGVTLDIEPLPILDIDTIADANLNRHIGLRTAKAHRARSKASKSRRPRKG
jgi:HTH-type transcriptional regulator / antitoxin HipB